VTFKSDFSEGNPMRIDLTVFSVLALTISFGSGGAISAPAGGFQSVSPTPSIVDQPRGSGSPWLKGGILVAEGCNRRLLLLDRATKRVVWQARGLRGAFCIEILPTGELVVGEGKSVAVIDSDGNVASRLPASFQITTDVKALEGRRLLVSDGAGGTVTEFDWNGNILWQITGLHWPSEAVRLENGNTLVADGTRRLKEFDSRGELVGSTQLKRWAAAVHRLSNGSTLVGEAGAVELLDDTGEPIWSRAGFSRATSARALSDGEILVCDPDGGRIVILDAKGHITWERTGLVRPWHAISLGE
jgi:outer membrane protein assembly factor BamB